MKDANFNFKNLSRDNIKGKFDYDDIRTGDLNCLLTNFQLFGPRISCNIESFKTIDRSGFEIKSLVSKMMIDSNQLRFEN